MWWKKALAVLNAGQIPVIACDQPLFKLAKEMQWTWPQIHGEDSFVVMLGGLHIKMTRLKSLGDLLYGDGWTSALAQAEVATCGTADSFMKENDSFRSKDCLCTVSTSASRLHRVYNLSTRSCSLSFEE